MVRSGFAKWEVSKKITLGLSLLVPNLSLLRFSTASVESHSLKKPNGFANWPPAYQAHRREVIEGGNPTIQPTAAFSLRFFTSAFSWTTSLSKSFHRCANLFVGKIAPPDPKCDNLQSVFADYSLILGKSFPSSNLPRLLSRLPQTCLSFCSCRAHLRQIQ